jgi:oxygen-independent coproporphyrinogen-3 oxidase
MSAPLAIYWHWPFCRVLCPYCDFNVHIRAQVDEAPWRAAISQTLAHWRARLGHREVTTLYGGGGTPGLMSPALVAHLIEETARHFTLSPTAEITLEANPETSEARRFAAFAAAGVNRLSLGVQSFEDATLAFLGRGHDAAAARAALDAAAVFPRLSFDLIYGWPGQSVAAWETELRAALAHARGHVSLYNLTIERGTRFGSRAARGETLTSDEDTAAALYETAQTMLMSAGLPAYEISNHAAPGEESRHNLAVWRGEDYLGLGPGAHGRLTLPEGRRIATSAHRKPERWLETVAVDGEGLAAVETLTPKVQAQEMLLLGLRTAEGVPHARLRARLGVSLDALFEATILDRAAFEQLVRRGFLENDAERFVATAAGRQRLNAVLSRLLA